MIIDQVTLNCNFSKLGHASWRKHTDLLPSVGDESGAPILLPFGTNKVRIQLLDTRMEREILKRETRMKKNPH